MFQVIASPGPAGPLDPAPGPGQRLWAQATGATATMAAQVAQNTTEMASADGAAAEESSII